MGLIEFKHCCSVYFNNFGPVVDKVRDEWH